MNSVEARVLPINDRRSRLCEIIRDRSLITDRRIRLASGCTTSTYFDLKRTMLDPEAGNLLAEEVLDLLRESSIDCVGGLAVGAVPLIQAVALRSYGQRPLRAFFVRSEIKDHGTRRSIEGNFEDGDRCVILDDVTTTGGSVLRAIEAVRERGATVPTVITVIDREEGAREKLRGDGVSLIALFTKADFVS